MSEDEKRVEPKKMEEEKLKSFEARGFKHAAFIPNVRRARFLSAMNRKEGRASFPIESNTFFVSWENFIVAFADNLPTTGANVYVKNPISLYEFTSKLESLIAYNAGGDGRESVVKFSDTISNYGEPNHLIKKLLDQITTLDNENHITIGLMQIKRRSISRGVAKIKIDKRADLFQVVIRHRSANGTMSVWKSLVNRLSGGKSKIRSVSSLFENDELEEKKKRASKGEYSEAKRARIRRAKTEEAVEKIKDELIFSLQTNNDLLARNKKLQTRIESLETQIEDMKFLKEENEGETV